MKSPEAFCRNAADCIAVKNGSRSRVKEEEITNSTPSAESGPPQCQQPFEYSHAESNDIRVVIPRPILPELDIALEYPSAVVLRERRAGLQIHKPLRGLFLQLQTILADLWRWFVGVEYPNAGEYQTHTHTERQTELVHRIRFLVFHSLSVPVRL